MIGNFHLSIINGLLLLGILCAIWLLYRINQDAHNKYNFVDILMGPNNRASTTNHILLAMAALSIWVVVDREMDGKDDVSTILLGVLGIFVTGKTATTITDIINKPADVPPPPPPAALLAHPKPRRKR